MTLSIFLKIMYKCLGQSSSITAFVIDLFEAILGEDVKNPLEEYPIVQIMHIVLFNYQLNQFVGGNKGKDKPRDWQYHRLG